MGEDSGRSSRAAWRNRAGISGREVPLPFAALFAVGREVEQGLLSLQQQIVQPVHFAPGVGERVARS